MTLTISLWDRVCHWFLNESTDYLLNVEPSRQAWPNYSTKPKGVLMDNLKLNPGSEEAIAAGCSCPVLDNARGKGYMGGAKDEDGNTIFVVSCVCPIHGDPKLADAYR